MEATAFKSHFVNHQLLQAMACASAPPLPPNGGPPGDGHYAPVAASNTQDDPVMKALQKRIREGRPTAFQTETKRPALLLEDDPVPIVST